MKNSPTTMKVRSVLLNRGLHLYQAAPLMGMSKKTIYNIVTGWSQSAVGRCRIESFIGIPVWSKAEDFVERLSIKQRLGIDPGCSSISEIRAAITQCGMVGAVNCRTRASLMEFLRTNLGCSETTKQEDKR